MSMFKRKTKRKQPPPPPTPKAKPSAVSRQIELLRSLPQGAAAWLLGIGARTLRDWQGVPRNPDRSYNARDLLRWYVKRERPADTDPMMVGSNSPALERYRVAHAQREELELAVRRGQLVSVDEFLTWYDAELAGPIRRSLEALIKHHSQAAADVVLRGLEAAEQAVNRRLKQQAKKRRLAKTHGNE